VPEDGVANNKMFGR